jgi:hypothetical protein
MIKNPADTDTRYRSLLQKAVRRGHVDLVYTTSALLESLSSKEKDWYRTRTAIITFEECWPFGSELNFNRKFHSKVAALIKVTRAQKIRDASGLGFLAYALYRGDTSVFDGSTAEKHIKIVANAIQRPDDFWQWISNRIRSDRQSALIENAMRFRHDGLPRDRAVILAAAYLAITSAPRTLSEPEPVDEPFPYWVTFDRHCREGRLALQDVARDLHIHLPQLEWTCFYFEGSRTNGDVPSEWWDRRCKWHFQKVGLPAEEAHLLWKPAKPYVMDALVRESRQLKSELYRWKLSNLKRIESLKRQVDLFIENFEAVKRDQIDLFD